MDSFNVLSGTQLNIAYELPEYQVLLDFNNNSDALAFMDWFAQNQKKFEAYVDTHGGDY